MEFRFLRYLESVVCQGDYSSSPLSLEAIESGEVPIYGILHPFFAKQRAYAAEFEKQGTRALVDRFGWHTSLNRKFGGDTRNMLTETDYLESRQPAWHGVFLLLIPKYAFNSLRIRIAPGKHTANMNGMYLNETMKIWEQLDSNKTMAVTIQRKNDLKMWLSMKKEKMERKYPRPADAASDSDAFR
eukprot:CAMPEP_0197724936 /NCGR_PEP_ID=MMETSP1434-20131217/6663_1 /TAXON_ID=265543 /ORGANISM="Minutocellus polymorphus, Strain CCMP3303" /LENGTH=185 /DNA_ID=CAMNT_0043310357 /DNA_START=263 /DNA_END=817 /DNA_ORIENTATION=+